MTKSRMLLIICPLILAATAVFAEGCNTTQPPNRQLSDAQVTTKVKAKLASDIGPSSLTNVDVTTTNGVVTLSGQVSSTDVRQKAETVTTSLPGVMRVNNNIQVQSASPPTNAQ